MRPLTSDDWHKFVRPGSRIFIGSNAACPDTLIQHYLTHASEIIDIEMVHILTIGQGQWTLPKYKDRIRVNALFLDQNSRSSVNQGLADYTPCFLSEIPGLFLQGVLPLDVALVSVTPPDDNGYCSFGVSVDIVSAACRAAPVVIAQINPKMPRTLGQSFIHVSEIDAYLEVDEDIPVVANGEMDNVTIKIGQYVASLIDDGATLQMGIGKIPDAVLANLTNHRNLGVHTEMFSDGILPLIKSGVINNSKKIIHRGKTITSFCMGSQKLYDFIHNNPHVEFHPSEYVNRPVVIAKNKNVIAINSAIEVDLTGQVASDSMGRRFYSGIGGQVDFIRGAAMSEGGRPIIALPSTAKDGQVSKIVTSLAAGAGVVTSRGDVHYVVTEYGIATLRGRSIRERALELIQIAHPKFREDLLRQVRDYGWLPPYHKHGPAIVKELGSVEIMKLQLKDGKEYILRPLKSSDDRRLQEFFYSHTKETLWQRYRNIPKHMTREYAHQLVNVDQIKDLALCIIERQGPREVIYAVGRYYLDGERKSAQVGLVVSELKRGLGMAHGLIKAMIDIASKRGVREMTGMVLASNLVMIRVFEKHGFTQYPTSDPSEVEMKRSL
ncbi:MAG: GNAT family N-acetyltransferase [Bdellovibrio sp.]|nr:GNAT family N-acetyltransferase [Bdellovibrio sp.]